ncbi:MULTISPECIES: hypothetical protein [unclassified Clostridium]|uniref:hypothetical protein n=1 Tax=unclassified Clostridium TaxID=2614128 RepID=UPI0025BB775C|nr:MULTISPECIES: hypothetical protein [unclassified Clostridium]
MEINFEGFDDLQKDLDNMVKEVEELGDEIEVQLEELLVDDFMAKHTNYNSLQDFIDGFEEVYGISDITDEVIESKQWHEFVTKNTDFESWNDMITIASDEYVGNVLGF